MVDPTSDLEANVDEESAPACERCGTPIVREPGHRVVTRIADDAVRTAHFCGEVCLAEWSGDAD